MKLFDRQKKWEINLYSYYDHAGIVRHLEDMARPGLAAGKGRVRVLDLPAVQTGRAALRRGVLFQGQSV